MKDVKCEIVGDLLVSYRDKMTTKETTEMLEEHLSVCDFCRDKYAKLQQLSDEEEKKETDRGKQFQKKLLTYRAYGIGFFIGLFLPVFILTGLFLLRMLTEAIQDKWIFF